MQKLLSWACVSGIGEHLLWIGRATYMVGDRPGGVALFEKGCQRHRCRACCGAEDELRRAIGTEFSGAGHGSLDGSRQGSEEPAGKGVHSLRRLGRMPSTMLASDTRATYMHEGSCATGASSAADACDPTFYGVYTIFPARQIRPSQDFYSTLVRLS
eukprot:COSAG02_NODE_10447_length_1939_cov_1.539130_4_plen_157_part_00